MKLFSFHKDAECLWVRFGYAGYGLRFAKYEMLFSERMCYRKLLKLPRGWRMSVLKPVKWETQNDPVPRVRFDIHKPIKPASAYYKGQRVTFEGFKDDSLNKGYVVTACDLASGTFHLSPEPRKIDVKCSFSESE